MNDHSHPLHAVRHLVLGTLLLVVLLQRIKTPRTRQSSRYHEFYARMTDEEFRRVFRVPRALFLRIVEALRPGLTYRCASPHLPPPPRNNTLPRDCSPSWAGATGGW